MLTQSDIERERYEARRKFQMDYTTTMNAERREGRAEGRVEGRVEGAINAFERLLGRPETPTEQLALLSLADLTRLADQLQEELRQRVMPS